MSILKLCVRITVLLLSAQLWAADLHQEASINPNKLGREYCQEKDIPVSFTPKPDDSDFRYTSVRVEDNKVSSKEPVCLPSIQTRDHEDNRFSPDDLKVRSKPRVLIPESACRANSPGAEGNRELCIYNEDGKLVATARYFFNTKQAAIKGYKNLKAINGQISFDIDHTPGAGSLGFQVCYGLDDKIDDSKDCNVGQLRLIPTGPSVTLNDLFADKKYFFKARLIENNVAKEWFKSESATPIAVNFPLDSYEGGGCQEAGSSVWLLLFTLVILGLSRFRKTALGMVLGLTLMIVNPKDAHADLGQMNIALLGAMYRPDLDSEKLSSGQKIFPFYSCHFGKDGSEGPINPLMGFEVDWHLWDGFGSVQLGLGASYTYAKGHGVKVRGGKPQCGEIYSEATAGLHMYQLRPQLTYIFDPYVDIVPLAPYVRAGLVGHGYVFTKDGKNAKQDISPYGFRFGYQVAVGLMLMLDFLEPTAVTNASSSGLFEHVYLKGELSYTKIDNFGARGFQFSPKDVMGTSLPLMWTFGLVFELPN